MARVEDVEGAGWFEDAKGFVAARKLKQDHRELTKDIAQLQRKVDDVRVRMSNSTIMLFARHQLEEQLERLEIRLSNFNAELDKLEKKAITSWRD